MVNNPEPNNLYSTGIVGVEIVGYNWTLWLLHHHLVMLNRKWYGILHARVRFALSQSFDYNLCYRNYSRRYFSIRYLRAFKNIQKIVVYVCLSTHFAYFIKTNENKKYANLRAKKKQIALFPFRGNWRTNQQTKQLAI